MKLYGIFKKMNNTDIEILLGLTEILKNHKTYTGEDYRVYNALDRVFNEGFCLGE